MSALEFGRGWYGAAGQRRALVWLSDVGWLVLDGGGPDISLVKRDLVDELDVRGALLGWEDHVDDPYPGGVQWVYDRLYWPETTS